VSALFESAAKAAGAGIHGERLRGQEFRGCFESDRGMELGNYRSLFEGAIMDDRKN
jgi:hypothetical protein